MLRCFVWNQPASIAAIDKDQDQLIREVAARNPI